MGRTINSLKAATNSVFDKITDKVLYRVAEPFLGPPIEAVCDVTIGPVLRNPMVRDILGNKKPSYSK